jgi:C-terminal processing protease CtpA/Prc/predicted small secreted protein
MFYLMKRLLPHLTLIVCLLVSGCSNMQRTGGDASASTTIKEQLFTPEQLRNDLAFIKQNIIKVHPAPFARLPESDFNALYKVAKRQVNWSQSRRQFFKTVAPLVASLSDIHTRLGYPEKEYQSFLRTTGRLPLALLYTDEGMVVVADQSVKPKIPTGAVISAINGYPLETESGQQRMLQMELTKLLWSEYQHQGDYRVDYVWRKKQYSQTLKGLTTADPQTDKLTSSHYGSLHLNEQTSLIWLNDFNEDYDVFEAFLEQFFSELQQYQKKNLIIDLRYNSGGISDNLALLLSFVAKEQVYWTDKIQVKVSEPFKEQQKEMLNQAKNQKYGSYFGWLPVEFFNSWRWELLFSSDGDIISSGVSAVTPREDEHFSGNIYVLTNGYCYSACAAFAANVKAHKLGLLVGEPPGSKTMEQFGFPVTVELPQTQLTLTIPAMQFSNSPAIQKFDEVPMDIIIKRSRVDVLLGRDPLLENVIKNTQKVAN